jgi:transposase
MGLLAIKPLPGTLRLVLPWTGRGSSTQVLPWYRPRSPFTKALEEDLLRQCVHQTLVDVYLRAGVPYDALDHYLTAKVDWASFTRLDTLGIDELALRKGHRAFVV